MLRTFNRPLSAFQSERLATQMENRVFRLTLAARNHDIFGTNVSEEQEFTLIGDRFNFVAQNIGEFFCFGEESRTGCFEQVRREVVKSLPLIFRGKTKYSYPSWRCLNLLLFYNSKESFTENNLLMFLVSLLFDILYLKHFSLAQRPFLDDASGPTIRTTADSTRPDRAPVQR